MRAEQIGILERSKDLALQYLTWSMTAEIVAMRQTGSVKQQEAANKPATFNTKRGRLPELKQRSIADPLRHIKKIDHAMWQMPSDPNHVQLIGEQTHRTCCQRQIAGSMVVARRRSA